MFSKVIDLFSVERSVPDGKHVVRVPDALGVERYEIRPRWKKAGVARFRVELGANPSRTRFGVVMSWGVADQTEIKDGRSLYRHTWRWLPYRAHDLATNPWFWWSPIQPLYWVNEGAHVHWTGRHRELVGFWVHWRGRRSLHWLASPI